MKNINYRNLIKESENPFFLALKKIYYFRRSASFPAPRVIYRPIFFTVGAVRRVFIFLYRQFWVIPRFKTLMHAYGDHLTAGIFVPFVVGRGRIHAGDRVRFAGKVDFIFGGITERVPEIHIGDNTTVGHGTTFDVSGSLTIGKKCLIASNVNFQDCNGHHVDPDKRLENVPLTEDQVKPITIGDNVWIGTNAYILPGSSIGSGSVIGARAVVKGHIPENSLVQTAAPVVRKIIKED